MITVVINGDSYQYPETNDTDWGNAATQAFADLTACTLQKKNAGEFAIENELSFGSSYGIKVLFVSTVSNNPAANGVFKLSNGELVAWRNGNNDGDNSISFDGSDNFVINGNTISFDVNGEMLVNGVQVTRSGEIVNADVAANAGIVESKLTLDHGTTSLYNNIETHKSNKTTAHGMGITTPVKDDTLIYDDIDSVWKNKPNTVDNLKNVNITSVQDGQILSYDLVNTEWKNTTNSVENLSDTNIISLQDGQIISYDNNSSKWINSTNSIENLSDTIINTPVSGQVIAYNGTKWENQPSASASLAGLTDTTFSNPVNNGDTILYNSVSTKWENSNKLTTVDTNLTLHTGNTSNPHSTKVSNLGEVSIDSNTLAVGDALVYDDQDSLWKNDASFTNHIGNAANPHLTTVAKLTDTTITSPQDKNVLLYDYANSKWVNSSAVWNSIEVNDVAYVGSTPQGHTVDGSNNVTMLSTDNRHQILTATDGFNITLPSTNIKAGEKFTFIWSNDTWYSTLTTPFVFKNADSTANKYAWIPWFIYTFTALVDNPTTTTDWFFDAKHKITRTTSNWSLNSETKTLTWTANGYATGETSTLFSLSRGVWNIRMNVNGGSNYIPLDNSYFVTRKVIGGVSSDLVESSNGKLGLAYRRNMPSILAGSYAGVYEKTGIFKLTDKVTPMVIGYHFGSNTAESVSFEFEICPILIAPIVDNIT